MAGAVKGLKACYYYLQYKIIATHNSMKLLKNLTKSLALKSTRSELDKLERGIRELPQEAVNLFLQAAINLDRTLPLPEHLPPPYNLHYLVSVGSTRADIQKEDQIRKDVTLLLPKLIELGRASGDINTRCAFHFWKVVLMTMLYDELYEEGENLWHLVLQLEDEDNSSLYDRRPIYYCQE